MDARSSGELRHKVKVSPVRIRTWDTDAVTTVQRTVAFRAECSCSEPFRSRSSYAAASADAREHRQATLEESSSGGSVRAPKGIAPYDA